MSTTVSALYNKLPSLSEAEEQFVSRSAVFATVGKLLGTYNHAFGLCLVHAHCTLAEDEIMLTRANNISEPEKTSSLAEHGDNYYAERWLASGEAYEFTTRPTESPPAQLMEAFHELTARYGGVLGLYYVHDAQQGKMIEYTEGRRNILMPYTGADEARAANQTETAWNLGRGDPVTMACVIVCDTITTRHGGAKHKGTKTHFKQKD
ncbi:MAG: hypothetical protein LQ343_002735 [Gyalolechia ehrenbergii]|nr:MAG: hypothetical protein LQ343_002735 [Gyalolechia ehrenbergii]